MAMLEWASRCVPPASINPRFFDPSLMFPPIVIPHSWSKPYFFPRPLRVKPPIKKETTRRIYLIRNGETAGMGTQREDVAYRNHSVYAKMDINQAVVTVSRASGPDAYADDPPLTQVGYSGAQLVGRSLSKRSLNIHTVYSSPSLRCIQTAISIIGAMNSKKPLKIRIEPALFEPLRFCTKIPSFLSSDDLVFNGYNVDDKYMPMMSIDDLKVLLKTEMRPRDVYARVERAVQRILAGRKEGGVLVISHAPILDAIYRSLTDRKDMPRTLGDLQRMVHNYPPCSVTTLQQDPMSLKWENREHLVEPLSYWHVTTMVNVPNFNS
uniref:Protein UBASH3A n=1 Tax=Ascaris suum TaxID=6253 RepID=F1L7A4_ASCSU